MNPMIYTDYKKYIRDRIELNQMERGYQGKLAEAAKCQKSYFSQILKNDTNLSLDQAMGLAEFWNLGEAETEYFLELVTLARSSSPSLTRLIKQKLKTLSERHEKQTKSAGASEIVLNDQWLYYSQWYWSAIHILVGIPKFQTPNAISKCLGLDESLVVQTLQALKSQGLVDLHGGRWTIRPIHRHLASESPINSMNHANWRQRAVLDSQRPSSDSLHYTTIHSHSRKDWEVLKQIFLDGISKSRSVIRPSADEEMSCMCIDLFRVSQ